MNKKIVNLKRNKKKSATVKGTMTVKGRPQKYTHLNTKTYEYTRENCEACGKRTTRKKGKKSLCFQCSIDMGLEDKVDADNETEALLKQLQKAKLSPAELRAILKTKSSRPVSNYHKEHFGKTHIKIGILPDMHVGSRYFLEEGFNYAIKRFDQEKVDKVYSVGDILEGMSGRDGHVYELDEVGYSAQLKKAVRLLKKIKQPFAFITGNHDEWYMNKADKGINVGADIEEKVPGSEYLGSMEATVDLGQGVRMWLTHRGATSYALSYSGQRMINNIDSSQKPHIIANGHLHKSIYFNYRDVHYFETGALQAQTEYMAMKGSPSITGFWIMDIELGRGRVNSMKPTWYPVESPTLNEQMSKRKNEKRKK